MANEFVAKRVLRFPEEMLVQLALGADPQSTVEEYGYDFDDIKDLPHYKAQFDRVERELLQDGEITRVIAGQALHQVVETVAYRILDPRMQQADLIKSGEFLKKVKEDGAQKQQGPVTPQFSIEINFPDGSHTKIVQHAPKPQDIPELEVEDSIPDDVIEHFNESKTGNSYDE